MAVGKDEVTEESDKRSFFSELFRLEMKDQNCSD